MSTHCIQHLTATDSPWEVIIILLGNSIPPDNPWNRMPVWRMMIEGKMNALCPSLIFPLWGKLGHKSSYPSTSCQLLKNRSWPLHCLRPVSRLTSNNRHGFLMGFILLSVLFSTTCHGWKEDTVEGEGSPKELESLSFQAVKLHSAWSGPELPFPAGSECRVDPENS